MKIVPNYDQHNFLLKRMQLCPIVEEEDKKWYFGNSKHHECSSGTGLESGIEYDQKALGEQGKFYEMDIDNYGGPSEVIINVPASKICDYYKAKKCSYMQVASHGFYILNGKDDFGLNRTLQSKGMPKIPDFKNSVKARIRCRCQIKSVSKKDYQFVMTLDFQSAVKSPYNLAPIMSAKNVKIKKSKTDDGLLTENNQALLSAINGE